MAGRGTETPFIPSTPKAGNAEAAKLETEGRELMARGDALLDGRAGAAAGLLQAGATLVGAAAIVRALLARP